MKNKKILSVVLALAAFCIIGCSSAPLPQYSFVEEGSGDKSASIMFVKINDESGVRLVDCDDNPLPPPPNKTNWNNTIILPAERPLDLRVYVFWDQDRFGERRRGIYRCPPLVAGQTYKLWYRGGLKGGSLILTYSDVNSLRYKSDKPQFLILHEQIIPPLPK